MGMSSVKRGGTVNVAGVRSIWLTFGVLCLPQTAFAATCREVMLSCHVPHRIDGVIEEITEPFNLQKVRTQRRADAWVAKHCEPVPLGLQPGGCDWRHLSRQDPVSYSPATTVVTDTPPNALPVSPESPPNRDNAKQGPTPAPKDPLDTGVFAAEVQAAAQKYKLPPQLVRAVMMTESGGNPSVLSNKGAVGLMQLLPATAREMGVDDIHDVGQNLMGGARFLRVLANRFDGDLVKVLSAYHAGSTRVLGRDATPFAATDDYVRKVLRLYYQLRDGR